MERKPGAATKSYLSSGISLAIWMVFLRTVRNAFAISTTPYSAIVLLGFDKGSIVRRWTTRSLVFSRRERWTLIGQGERDVGATGRGAVFPAATRDDHVLFSVGDVGRRRGVAGGGER